jgi:hypothetical protein
MSERQGSAESVVDKREASAPDAVNHVAPESLARAHEVQEVNWRALLVFVGGLVAVVVVIALVLGWWLGRQTNQKLEVTMQVPPAQVTPPSGPGPGVEPFQRNQREATVETALEHITTYGWVDRDSSVVHIPIDEAMKRLVDEGVPAAEGEPPTFDLEPAYTLDSSSGQRK